MLLVWLGCLVCCRESRPATTPSGERSPATPGDAAPTGTDPAGAGPTATSGTASTPEALLTVATPEWRLAANPVAVGRGAELAGRFECNRCHDLPGPPAHPDKACVGCHQRILRGEFQGASPEAVADWKRNIVHLTAVPSLRTLDRRVRRDWIARYLLTPTDQRPRLAASMPRLPMTADQAESIAAFLAPSAVPDEPALGDASAGEAAWTLGGCAACHGEPDADAPAQKYAATQIALAPDLRNLREKYHTAGLIAWLESPTGYMPAIPTDAPAVAAYLMARTPPAPPTRTVPPRLPVLERRVRYKEIEDRLFLAMCWHCHSEPDLARGDGGPGNSGGFGFRGVGLSLASYAATASGSLDETGRRQSIFRKGADGTPQLVAVLRARQMEEAGQWDPTITGMPLGLPAISPEDLQLVESWVAQGRPQ